MNAYFERKACEWQETVVVSNGDMLNKVMLLLAIFEPVAPLELDLIQGYLQTQGITVRQAELVKSKVGAQIDGLDERCIKLSLRAFGEYIRASYCSRHDLKNSLEQVTNWLANENLQDAKILSLYLEYWTDPELISDDLLRRTAQQLTEIIFQRQNGELLVNIFYSSEKKNEDGALVPSIFQCLELAARFGKFECNACSGH